MKSNQFHFRTMKIYVVFFFPADFPQRETDAFWQWNLQVWKDQLVSWPEQEHVLMYEKYS